jgi:hypothetical protein
MMVVGSHTGLSGVVLAVGVVVAVAVGVASSLVTLTDPGVAVAVSVGNTNASDVEVRIAVTSVALAVPLLAGVVMGSTAVAVGETVVSEVSGLWPSPVAMVVPLKSAEVVTLVGVAVTSKLTGVEVVVTGVSVPLVAAAVPSVGVAVVVPVGMASLNTVEEPVVVGSGVVVGCAVEVALTTGSVGVAEASVATDELGSVGVAEGDADEVATSAAVVVVALAESAGAEDEVVGSAVTLELDTGSRMLLKREATGASGVLDVAAALEVVVTGPVTPASAEVVVVAAACGDDVEDSETTPPGATTTAELVVEASAVVEVGLATSAVELASLEPVAEEVAGVVASGVELGATVTVLSMTTV